MHGGPRGIKQKADVYGMCHTSEMISVSPRQHAFGSVPLRSTRMRGSGQIPMTLRTTPMSVRMMKSHPVAYIEPETMSRRLCAAFFACSSRCLAASASLP